MAIAGVRENIIGDSFFANDYKDGVFSMKKTVPLYYLEAIRDTQKVKEYRRFQTLFLKELWERISPDIFLKLLNRGPFGVELVSKQYVDYEQPEPMFIYELYINLQKTEKVHMRYIETATPRFDLLTTVSDDLVKAKKKVFFCRACGTPYFWGNKHCSSCGIPLDYENSKEFDNDF